MSAGIILRYPDDWFRARMADGEMDYDEIAVLRARLWRRVESCPKTQRMLRGYYQRLDAQAIYDWSLDWAVGLDPRNLTAPTKGPFVAFPRQAECIQWARDAIEQRKSGAIVKCRDSGGSYLFAIMAVAEWLFNTEQTNIAFASEKQSKVDSLGDADTLIQKCRILILGTPPSLRPIGFNSEKHLSFMRLFNPATRSVIKGESGLNIGRGGRTKWTLVDEAAFVRHLALAIAALSQAAGSSFYLSTQNEAPPSPFALLSEMAPSNSWANPFTFDWWQDPRKNEKWYDREFQKLRSWPGMFDREVLRKYGATNNAIFIEPQWIRAAQRVETTREWLRGPKIVGFDPYNGGNDAHGVVNRQGSVVSFSDEWTGFGVYEAGTRLLSHARQFGAELVLFDEIGIGATVGNHGIELQKGLSHRIKYVGLNAGGSAGQDLEPESRRPFDLLVFNAKARWWWEVRRRFERTWEFVEGRASYSPSQMISIPNDPVLAAQLAAPYMVIDDSLVRVESKQAMAKRNVASPNRADALMLAFSPDPIRRF